MNLSVVILAAGQGTRMRSDLPKVLQPLAGRPLLEHVIDAAEQLKPDQICVVYGHGADLVKSAFAKRRLDWALQAEQLGTGHAVQQALPKVDPANTVLILCGDVPLVRAETLRALVSAGQQGLAVLTADIDEPTGYGRIVRSGETLKAIVEEKDASNEQKQIREINTGLMACKGKMLAPWLERLAPDNAQGEYYLTDIVGCAVDDGVSVVPVKTDAVTEVLGINDRRQLAGAERLYRLRAADALFDQGVTLADPQRIDVRGELSCGKDVFIDINTVFSGNVRLGDGVTIGPNTIISDASIGAGTVVLANCVIENASIGNDCNIGPYSRIRPGVEMADNAKLGNFVEVKKSKIGKGSKVNHLTYIGDANIGADVNVGAGTITCNYDGANKHITNIGDGAFIGSGVELVAPVDIGAGATIGAGSTISKSAPSGELTLERAKQATISGWRRPKKGGKG